MLPDKKFSKGLVTGLLLSFTAANGLDLINDSAEKKRLIEETVIPYIDMAPELERRKDELVDVARSYMAWRNVECVGFIFKKCSLPPTEHNVLKKILTHKATDIVRNDPDFEDARKRIWNDYRGIQKPIEPLSNDFSA